MLVRFLDLRVTDSKEHSELLQAIGKVLSHGRIMLGPEVEELEGKVAAYCGRKYSVGMSSGTESLFLALKSLGIRHGDEVITTPLSFVASANAIVRTGASPVFADIREDLNIDPEAVRSLITAKTKAILPVHWTGKICEMTELTEIASKHELFLIEDASQAFGAKYHGKSAGGLGVLGCFSLNSMKVFAALGEAGIITTDSLELKEKLLSLRYNGLVGREACHEVGINGKIDTLQAAVLLYRLQSLEKNIQRRRDISEIYRKQLSEVVETPLEQAGCRDTYYTYTIRAENRDQLKLHLEQNGIETKIQHKPLIHHQPYYEGKYYAQCPLAEKLFEQVLCLPIHEKLTDEEVAYVISKVRGFYKRH